MYLSKKAIEDIPRVERLKLINAISGIKSGNLVGTVSSNGHANLSIISSVVHLGSNPALLGFIVRPHIEIRRHTLENIMANGVFTINHIHASFIEKAHYTSVKFEEKESEFEKCKLTPEYKDDFIAPFVKESYLKIGLNLREIIPIASNNTTMIVGEVEHLFLPSEALDEKGYLNLEQLGSIGIGGLNTYYKVQKIKDFPYARLTELPDFE